MEAIGIPRTAQQILAARSVGLAANQPTQTLANQRSRGNASDVYAMPLDGSEWLPLQVTDPSSPDFGKTYFLPGYDVPGDPTKVVL